MSVMMICNNAGKCKVSVDICRHKVKHVEYPSCEVQCESRYGVIDSFCVPCDEEPKPTVPGWYWVKLPLTRSFVMELSKEDIERKYILLRLGDGRITQKTRAD